MDLIGVHNMSDGSYIKEIYPDICSTAEEEWSQQGPFYLCKFTEDFYFGIGTDLIILSRIVNVPFFHRRTVIKKVGEVVY